MSKTLYVTWQDSNTRHWYPVGLLEEREGAYLFRYINGALEAQSQSGFNGFQSFSDFQKVYTSKTLFPIFQNRILSETRPEYVDFLSWLALPKDELGPIAILARTGGKRVTDAVELFAKPEITSDGLYNVEFFVHGIRHIDGAEALAKTLKAGDDLFLEPEPHNSHDRWALKIRKDSNILGYCPKFLNQDINRLISDTESKHTVSVFAINRDPIPVQFRVLCRFQTRWPKGFKPFEDFQYLPIEQSTDSMQVAV